MSSVPATRQDNPVASARPIDTVRAALEKMKPQIAMALPDHLTADRLLRIAITAVQNTPKLLDCDRTSLYSAIMACAQLGLEPDGVLGQAYLVPFGNKVVFVPGYKGLITLARNSGEVRSIIAHEVCANDIFGHRDDASETYHLNLADPEPPTHRLDYLKPRGDVIAFYAIARFKDGGCHWDVLPKPDIDAIRDASQGYRTAKRFAKDGVINSPWATNYIEMGKKTAIRRIAKYLPMSVQKAAALADAYDTGRHARLDTHGELVIESAEAAPQISGPQPSSRLERFEGGDEQPGPVGNVDPETGEVTPDPAATVIAVPMRDGAGGKKIADWMGYDAAVREAVGKIGTAAGVEAFRDANHDNFAALFKADEAMAAELAGFISDRAQALA